MIRVPLRFNHKSFFPVARKPPLHPRPPKVVKKALWGLSFYLPGQTNRKGWFFHCKKPTRKGSPYYFEKRIVGLTDELRGKMDLLSFQKAFLESNNSIQFGFGKLSAGA